MNTKRRILVISSDFNEYTVTFQVADYSICTGSLRLPFEYGVVFCCKEVDNTAWEDHDETSRSF
jgi:hypothetical protein